jgi:hypothetical protein
MNTRIVLRQRPQGWVDESCFGIEHVAEPQCDPGDVLLQSLQAVLTKRITMTAFNDPVHKLPAYRARVAPWLRNRELVFREDEQAPAALIVKRLVQVAPE